jgi:hypothetical protein
LLFSSFKLYSGPLHWAFISNVNFIFHEAGHAIFFVFGDFVHALGGTLGELLIPLAVIFHFLRQGNRFALGFSLWWLSTALLNISVYAADAQERMLPLITGDPGTHDWWHMLNVLGVIKYDNFIGNIFYFLSIFVLLYACVVIYRDLKEDLIFLVKKFKIYF